MSESQCFFPSRVLSLAFWICKENHNLKYSRRKQNAALSPEFPHLFGVPHSTKMPHNAAELEMAQYETAKYCHSMVDTDIW